MEGMLTPAHLERFSQAAIGLVAQRCADVQPLQPQQLPGFGLSLELLWACSSQRPLLSNSMRNTPHRRILKPAGGCGKPGTLFQQQRTAKAADTFPDLSQECGMAAATTQQQPMLWAQPSFSSHVPALPFHAGLSCMMGPWA